MSAQSEKGRIDPLLHGLPLPLRRTLSVSGFPVSIATNDSRALQAADEAWAGAVSRFRHAPIEIHIVVQAGRVAADPVFRASGTLLAVVAGRDNFGVADFARGAGFLSVTDRTVEDGARFRWAFLESMVYTMLVYDRVTPLHAACVERAGMGYLLCGPSGAGKSTLAFTCARRGWHFVSDEASFLVGERSGYTVAGRPRSARLRPDSVRWFESLRGNSPAVHPNGKESVEVAMHSQPELRVSPFCEPRGLVTLRRGCPGRRFLRVPAGPVVSELLGTIPWLGPEAHARHERDIAAVAARGVWELEYDTPDDGAAVLDELAGRHG